MIDSHRRTLLKGFAAGSAALILPAAVCGKQAGPSGESWLQATLIRNSISRPRFPDREFDVRNFGAKGDNKTDDSAAIQTAIDRCAEEGGGRVLIRDGVFVTGPVHLKSNINLHIERRASLSFLTDPKRYLPPVLTRWEGVELMGYSPLIYAYEQRNIAITGKGSLHGNANRSNWWPWKGNKEWGLEGAPGQAPARERLFADAENNVPVAQRVYAEGSYLRPPFIQPYRCRDVLIEDVTITDAPFWLIHPVLCENVTVSGVTCRSRGPNSDGCDPESCRNVLIENCLFDTGDDCIAIKSGRNADGRRLAAPSENLVIAGCRMRAGHGGVVIGSEISGGARNIFVEESAMSSPDLERGIRIKTNSLRGGTIENFHIRNVDIGTVQDAIVIDFYYEEGDAGGFDPIVKNIVIEDLHCRRAAKVFQIRGYARSPVTGLSLKNARFERVEDTGVIENVADFTVENLYINGKKRMFPASIKAALGGPASPDFLSPALAW
ncbi:MAG TPA: glycoside hydrolase family 28 protein [Gammaproteobacteria bacterium]|nr:glycoside hydrolase family 28 protein [Gammaproteobacteria bacterium]